MLPNGLRIKVRVGVSLFSGYNLVLRPFDHLKVAPEEMIGSRLTAAIPEVLRGLLREIGSERILIVEDWVVEDDFFHEKLELSAQEGPLAF